MKTNSKIPKRSFFAVMGVISIIVPTVMGQRAEQTDDQLLTVIKTPNKQVKARVVAIRRVSLIIDGRDTEGFAIEKRVPHVEIEIYVGKPEFNTQSEHLVQIGDREFGVYTWNPSDSHYNAVLLLPAREFDELTDGADIYFRLGTMIPRETFKKLHDEGKLASQRGIKVGKLDKKMIDLEPTVERSSGWKPPY